jgi:hypothetical protein
MKKLVILLCAISVITFISCASTETSNTGTVQTVAPSPIVGAEGVPMPEWVRNIPEAEDVMYFVGEGREGSTPTAKKNSALQDAARQIGDWKSSVITSAIKDYVQEAGETANTQSLEFLEVSSIAKAKANTSGMHQSQIWVNEKGYYVILVKYPKADLKSDFKQSLNEFVRNESAAYAEFKADEAFRYLEKEMD